MSPPRTRTYHVIDGDGQEDEVPDVRRRKNVRRGVYITIATTLVTAAAAIATSRWGGVSKEVYENGRAADALVATQRHTETKSELSAVKGDVSEIRNTVAGLKALLDQQVLAKKPRARRAPVETP